MSRPIRVMHVMGHMMGGGVEATIMNHYRHIDRGCVQFDFVVDEDSTTVPREEIEALGGRVFVVPPYKKLPHYLKACEQLFREQKPDIVHSNINALSVFPLAAAKQVGVPVRIAHSHSTSNPRELTKTLMKNMLKPFSKVNPTHLAACSEYSARWLFGDRVVDAGDVQIIKNAVDLDYFAFNPEVRARKRAELGIKDDQLVIGQVGRMCTQKNQMFSLKVFSELLRRLPNAVLVFAGDGEMHQQLKYKAREQGIDTSVKFLGARNDVNELYQAFDELILPSVYEGLPVTAVEAQTSGLPIIVSCDVSDETFILPDLIHPLELSSPVEDWVNALLDTETMASQRQYNDKKMAEAGYDINHSAKDLCCWYQKLVTN